MYSQEDRLRAVKVYFELDNNPFLTVLRLGYPAVTTLAYWGDEYQRKHSLHYLKRRYSKYSTEEKYMLSDNGALCRISYKSYKYRVNIV